MSLGIGPQVDISPRLQAFIDALKQTDILRIIPAHSGPGLEITVYATAPESGACIRKLATAAEIPPDIIELIAVEFEFLTRNFKRVNCFKGTRWRQPMDHEAGADFLHVEGIAVMRDDYIRTIKHLPKLPTQMRIVCFADVIIWIVREAMRLYWLSLPAHCKA